MTSDRRSFLRRAATSVAATGAVSSSLFHTARALAQTAPAASGAAALVFHPQPGAWRQFDVTTRVDVADAKGFSQAWLPVPSVDSDWQRTLTHDFTTNGKGRFVDDGRYGARMLHVVFNEGEKAPFVELTSRVQTRNRATDWSAKVANEDAATLKFWTEPTKLLPTDGIVRETAMKAIQGARDDREKAQAIYNWVVTNTYREPKTKGCGPGDIKTMLETGNLGGKCADLNAMFVGLCRSVGLPARDVYGVRLAPSAFGYKQLGGNSASLKGAQHCRAEVFLSGLGWLAMDPADVTTVMRHEAPEWIKTTQHPLVAPVNEALFGGWEGNWMAWNMAHDITLPGAKGPELGFFMYPAAETGGERLDSYDPDAFKYQITASEIKA